MNGRVLGVAAGFFILGVFSCGPTDPPVPSEPPPSCSPTTCEDAGAQCGELSDGCGATLQCGTCADGESCGGGGTPNVCGQQCVPVTCEEAGKNCGSVPDGCGGSLECGSCADGETCGGGGTANVCGEACVPLTCEGAGKNCGSLLDGCGGTIACGACADGETCGGGGAPNVCGEAACVPTTCEALGAVCGEVSDGCGATLSCGGCAEGETCSEDNACVPDLVSCVPTTCAAEGKNCGTLDDGCGETLECGTCSDGETCGGGGEANVCGAEAGGPVSWAREWNTPLLTVAARESGVVALQGWDWSGPVLLEVLSDGRDGWSQIFTEEGNHTLTNALEVGTDGRIFISGSTAYPEEMTGSHYVVQLSNDASEQSTVARRDESASLHVVSGGRGAAVAWILVDTFFGAGWSFDVRKRDGSTWRSSNAGNWWFGTGALGMDGSLAIAGRLTGVGTLDGREVGTEGQETVVLAVLEEGGALRWMHQLPSTVTIQDLGVSESGAVIAAVSFSETLTWAGTSATASGGRALLMAAAGGAQVRMRALPPQPARESSHQIFPFSMAVDLSGVVAVATGESCSVEVRKFDANLEPLWTHQLERTECTGAIDAEVELLPNEEVILGGRYRGEVELGGAPVLSQRDDFGGFLLKLER